MTIIPFGGVFAIAVWSAIHTYRMAHPKFENLEAMAVDQEQGHQA